MAPLLVVLGVAGCRQEPGSVWEPYAGLHLNGLVSEVSVIHCSAPAEADPGPLLEPVLRLGVTDGRPEYQFHQVAGVVRTVDGHLLVADGGSNQLRIYSPEGRHLRSVGGEGAGPGEFNGIDWMARGPGDTVVLWDSALGRGSRFTIRGDFIDSFTLPSVPDYPLLHAEGAFDDGTVLAQAGPPREVTDTEDSRWNVVGVYRLEQDGAEAGAQYLGDFPSQYVPNEQCTLGADCAPEAGGVWAMWHTDANRLLYARGDIPEVLLFDGAGGTAQVIRAAEPIRRASPAGAIVPPYFDALLADDAGRVWARQHQTKRWIVIDTTDGCRRQVGIPAGVTIHHIRGAFVSGAEHDDLGVERVVVYTVE